MNAVQMLLFDSSDDEEEHGQQRHFRQRQYFELEDFKERFRLSRTEVNDLISRIGHHLTTPTNRSEPLSPLDKVLSALRFYASGDFYYSIADCQGVSKASVKRSVHHVTKLLNEHLFLDVVSWPDDTRHIATQFYNIPKYWRMPTVAGCIDGTLIPIKRPRNNEEQFIDRHGNHSINAMFVCGPNLKFYYCSARWPGSVHDARVLRNSSLSSRCDSGWRPFPHAILLGDTAYPLKDWIIPPIANPQTAQERAFNRAHRSTRRLIECAYGVLKESFQCLKKLRVDTPALACDVIRAVAVIHNLRTADIAAADDDAEDGEDIMEENNVDQEDGGREEAGERRLRQLLLHNFRNPNAPIDPRL